VYKALKTSHSGKIQTHLFCSDGGDDDHNATPPGPKTIYWRNRNYNNILPENGKM
jgi:hypothetical protein